MAVSSISLEKLNHLGETKNFKLEDAAFTVPDRSKLWAPPSFGNLSYLKSFALLTKEQQHRYNQLYSLSLLEHFIWFEELLLCPLVRNILKEEKDPVWKKAFEIFIEDEERHSEMFWRLLQLAEPKMYPERQFKFFGLKPFEVKTLNFMIAHPKKILIWIWLGIFFEERTLDYSKRFVDIQLKSPGLVDPNFVLAHRLHLIDEARHFQLDVHLVERFYKPAHWIYKKFASVLYYRMMAAYTSPRRAAIKRLRMIQEEFPDLQEETVQKILEEVPSLGSNAQFLKMGFGKQAVPRSRELIGQFEELRPVLDLFDNYKEDPAHVV